MSNDIYCSLELTKRAVDKDALEQAAKALLCAQQIFIYGLGNSASVALDFEHKLLRAGLRAAAAEGADRLVVRASYFSTDRAGVEQMVRDVQEEKDGGRDAGILAAPWQVSFYPDTDEPGIVEILLK